ncbi:glutathione S-transferase N-terminal domain-containing protein [Cupriavidus sp. EM10]|uniref:glutathione S-transferase N-terminal domain-containing protein n=2 Tax=unclassified Cupriavidus TaxID=2640874 RepID=UPI001CED3227|nr:glutathione S-transferase N-terminal domain-containing protein [Cupriavidus sp. EM10]
MAPERFFVGDFMIRLHDFELSGSCYKIRLLLNMLSVPYEKVSVDYVGQQHESADYLELNPFGELPVHKQLS